MTSVLTSTVNRLRDAAAWRVRRVLGDARVDSAWVAVAKAWRPTLKRPVFIGVTGSAGKTTTKELLLGILSASKKGVASPGSLNVLPEVAKTVMRVRPSHDFCVVELSEAVPGVMDNHVSLLRPSVGVVTVVGNDHWSAFGSREAIADEMRKLIASLPASGTAVLNADDEQVLSMGSVDSGCVANVLTYGTSPTANLRAEEISAVWPDRLEFTLVRNDNSESAKPAERLKVKTQLCGTHWIPSVLGAMGGALATGLTLAQCAEGIARVAPFEGRMQPVVMPNGVTFIRDDYKAPLWTTDACLEFMLLAKAKRKILVFGSLSDCGAGAPEKYAKVAKRAQEIADITVFVGPWASQVLKARKAGAPDALKVFRNVRDAADFINKVTLAGDLVLLKGTNKQDHLLRVIMARTDSIACWRDDCERHSFCNECVYRTRPSGLPLLMGAESSMGTPPGASASGKYQLIPGEQLIVGLGNPEPKYSGTPHNVGFEVVEKFAASVSATWQETPEAWIARGELHGKAVCLVKIKMPMNLIGAGLKRLSEAMGFGPEQCILVYDDLDMPLGATRARVSGGAGGHRGVTSILEAFQTDAFRRVKVGVGQEGAKLNKVAYVLTPFAASSRDAVDTATSAALAQLVEMVKRPSLLKKVDA